MEIHVSQKGGGKGGGSADGEEEDEVGRRRGAMGEDSVEGV